MYNRNIEIREAIEAGERALVSLQDARESLGSARNWGLLDMFGGRSISGLVKHVKIDKARQSLNRAKADLNRFIDILPRLKPWDSNSRKKASLIPAKSITFGRFRSAAYATAMALGI